MEFVKHVKFFKPKVFLMENVIGILSMKTASNKLINLIIDIILDLLSEEYNVKYINYMQAILKFLKIDVGLL